MLSPFSSQLNRDKKFQLKVTRIYAMIGRNDIQGQHLLKEFKAILGAVIAENNKGLCVFTSAIVIPTDLR